MSASPSTGPMPVSKPTRKAIALLALGALLIGSFLAFWTWRQPAEPVGTVANAIPSDAQVVVLADLARIRQSPYRALFAGGSVPSMMPGTETGCGKNLTERIETLALWAPAEPGASFGVAARAPVSADAVWACAQATIAARGGRPSFDQVEGFRVITDEAMGPGSAQIAVRDPGLLLLGRPATRSRMMDALAGRTPSIAEAGDHARLREALGGDSDLVLTVVVTPTLRERVSRWLGEPLPLLASVPLLAAAAQLRPTTHLLVVVRCEAADACDRLTERLRAKRERMTTSLPMRAMGVAALLEDARIEPQGSEVRIALTAPADRVLGVIERLGALEEALEREPRPRLAPSGSVPDEIIRPDAGR